MMLLFPLVSSGHLLRSIAILRSISKYTTLSIHPPHVLHAFPYFYQCDMGVCAGTVQSQGPCKGSDNAQQSGEKFKIT